MNCNVTINWKTIAAAGISGVAWILAFKMEREDAKEILSGMVNAITNKLSLKND